MIKFMTQHKPFYICDFYEIKNQANHPANSTAKYTALAGTSNTLATGWPCKLAQFEKC